MTSAKIHLRQSAARRGGRLEEKRAFEGAKQAAI